MMNPAQMDVAVQAPTPGAPLPPVQAETNIKIRPLERIKLHPKAPIEPKGRDTTLRSWILQDGRASKLKGSEMKDQYKTPNKYQGSGGVRRRMLTDFFWEEMLRGLVDDIEEQISLGENCSEYDSNFVKEGFEPRDLSHSKDQNLHLKYPLYGTGSSAITFYKETIKSSNGEILEQFRRNQDFSKPMEERLDDGWVL